MLHDRGLLHPVHLATLTLVGLGVELVALVPAHLVLTRVQASMLSVEEQTIVPLDETLQMYEKHEAVGMIEAWRTVGWRAWGRLTLFYLQVFVVLIAGGGIILAAEFVIYIFSALAGM
jgi:hypothetical protein